jgi:lysophospholipase L1-like esterase
MRRLCTLAAFLCSPALLAASDFYLHDGDTVVFYGDSITNQRMYTAFTEAFVLTRFPHLRIRFIHSGFSGDRVSGGAGGTIEERLKHDVFAYHPTVVTVMLGMNDGEYRAYDTESFNKYASGYRDIIRMLKSEAPEARITLLQTSPYDDITRPPTFAGGYNAVLLRFGDFVGKLAKTEMLTVADLNAPSVALLRAANKLSPEAARELIPDRVHPSAGIHLIMAEALLKSWHAPSLVTSVEIDASTDPVVRSAENTAVDSLQSDKGLSWTQTDDSLPMPLDGSDAMIQLAVRLSDLTKALNQELLKVTGLQAGTYRLSIDDGVVGTFNDKQLAEGINLATMKTPMSAQAQLVLDLTHRHNHLHFARWRMVEDALRQYPLTRIQPALDALDTLEEEVISFQRASAIPKPHRYHLTKEQKNESLMTHGANSILQPNFSSPR